MTQPNEITLYLGQLAQLRQAVREALLGLAGDALNWRPLPEETNSLYNLAQHCAWVEQWWIGCVLGKQPVPYTWTDNEDLEGQGEDSADLLFWLDEAATTTRAVLETLQPEDLDGLHPVRRPSAPEKHYAGRWTIVHTIEHYAEHMGQMRLTRQLWEAQRT